MVDQAVGWLIGGLIYVAIAAGMILLLVSFMPLFGAIFGVVPIILEAAVAKPIGFIWKPLRRCEHGIRGGGLGGACVQCDRLIVIQIERRERAARSEALFKSELARLHKAILAEEMTLRELEPGRFEDTICQLYESLGYSVERTPRSRDGGRDAIMHLRRDKILLECKRYNSNRAGRPDVQKFHSAMVTDLADGGIFVCLSGFTKDAKTYAEPLGIELVDKREPLRLMKDAGWSSSNSRQYMSLCEDCGQRNSVALDDEAVVRCACGELISRRLDLFTVIRGPR